jgi:ABC-type glycerol-3-phosphate transport system substrate-binding protein
MVRGLPARNYGGGGGHCAAAGLQVPYDQAAFVGALRKIEGSGEEINFANYWVETAMAKSKNINEAWDFIQFAAKPENVKSYLEKTKKPTALRSLIEEEKEDPDIGIFAKQLLTAKSWYKGKDAVAMEKIFNDMIDEMLSADPEKDPKNIINRAASKVQQTID